MHITAAMNYRSIQLEKLHNPITPKTTVSVEENKMGYVSVTTPEEQIVVAIRFKEYFDQVDRLEIKEGEMEPSLMKSLRPFLLANEATSSGSNGLRKKGKGKKLGGKGELAKVFTEATPPNFVNRFIPSNQPYKITQQLNAGTLMTTSTTVPTFSATSFSVNSLDQISQLAAVFDQYMIEELEVWVFPNTLGAATGAQAGLLYSAIDYDDAATLSTIGQIEDYTNVVVSTPNQGHYRRFVPHIAVAAYSGSFTSFMNVDTQWIDSAYTNVQHYGLKIAATATPAAQSAYTLQVRYHLAFRNVR